VPHIIDISLRFALDEQFLQIFKPAVCEGDDLLFVGSIDTETAVFRLHVDCKVSQQLLVLAEDLSEMRDSEYVSWRRHGLCPRVQAASSMRLGRRQFHGNSAARSVIL